MRTKMRRFTQAVAFLSFALILSSVFQNCGTYEPAYSPLYDNASSTTCTGFSCATDPDFVEIQLGHIGQIKVRRPSGAIPADCTNNDSRCFDVAGYCETAGYPDSLISVELRGPTGFSETATASKCDENGRFRLLVALPANYDYDSIHELIVTMRAISASGQLIDNPRETHRARIPVISFTN